jgi:hypothetical protein
MDPDAGVRSVAPSDVISVGAVQVKSFRIGTPSTSRASAGRRVKSRIGDASRTLSATAAGISDGSVRISSHA